MLRKSRNYFLIKPIAVNLMLDPFDLDPAGIRTQDHPAEKSGMLCQLDPGL